MFASSTDFFLIIVFPVVDSSVMATRSVEDFGFALSSISLVVPTSHFSVAFVGFLYVDRSIEAPVGCAQVRCSVEVNISENAINSLEVARSTASVQFGETLEAARALGFAKDSESVDTIFLMNFPM